MTSTLTIHPESPVTHEGHIEWAAAIEETGRDARMLWFRVNEAGAAHVSSSVEAFVLAALFYAMRNRLDIHVNGPVCSSLLRNLHEYQLAWSKWKPDRYQMIEIEAQKNLSRPTPPVADTALSAFSGGLDSCFTIWSNTQEARFAARQPVQLGLMAHGLDIPIWDAEVFSRAAEKSRQILSSVGVPLQTLATNLRMFEDDWSDSHGAGVAACLHAMSGQHAIGLIPGTHAYEALRFPFGSNPVTDPLLSSARLSIVYDGAGFSRVEKAAAVAEWPAAMQQVRVCWSGDQLDRNCGACTKCVALGICFAVNELPIPESLPIKDLAAAIRAVMHIPLEPAGVQRMDERLELIEQRGIQAPWVAAAKEWRRRSIQSRKPMPRWQKLLSPSQAFLRSGRLSSRQKRSR